MVNGAMNTENELVKAKAHEGAVERTTAEVAVQRFVAEDGHQTSDLLAVEEPLELQLGYGPADQRKVKSRCVHLAMTSSWSLAF
jgi:hypothetical protein